MPLLTLRWDIPRRPQCPVCNDPLQNDCFCVRDSIAVCRQCYGMLDWEMRVRLCQAADDQTLHAYWCIVNGVSFYHRPIYDSVRRSAWLVGQAIGRPAVSPADPTESQVPVS